MGCHTNSRHSQETQIFSPLLPCQCDLNEPKTVGKKGNEKNGTRESVGSSDSTMMLNYTY